MPNWIEGTLKLRGKRDNILKFFREGINVYETNFADISNPILQDRDKWYEEVNYYDGEIEITFSNDVYIEGTRRAFFEPQTVYLFDKEVVTVCLSARQAWSYKVEQFFEIAQKYHISIKGYGIECGMEFCQEFEIISETHDNIHATKIKLDRTTDYNDWDWECPFPRMGG